MKKIVVMLIISILLVYGYQVSQETDVAVITNDQLSHAFLSKNIPIIDIRTQDEWNETGVVKDSILLTFYKKDKSFNEDEFLNKLDSRFDKKSTFAILCRSGNRSNRVTRFLFSKGYSHIINLAGGIKQGIKNKIDLIKYKNSQKL